MTTESNTQLSPRAQQIAEYNGKTARLEAVADLYEEDQEVQENPADFTDNLTTREVPVEIQNVNLSSWAKRLGIGLTVEDLCEQWSQNHASDDGSRAMIVAIKPAVQVPPKIVEKQGPWFSTKWALDRCVNCDYPAARLLADLVADPSTNEATRKRFQMSPEPVRPTKYGLRQYTGFYTALAVGGGVLGITRINLLTVVVAVLVFLYAFRISNRTHDREVKEETTFEDAHDAWLEMSLLWSKLFSCPRCDTVFAIGENGEADLFELVEA